ncbi:DeoR/GlpR family DNA-binding transcription regulator [Aliiruegeria sabulilitoris]|uniref:DeoR/GlpR family DNA-binding transcription regulator n=1 Tax=Aliiruegeria sabulilitoris TaxID=1510458 RepID=UPI000830903E|nr:DeoR/GlpR family DNA-binding transcription regulator [Aliiruegeria sabulilitoris]NDR59306.1 DeoR/GlpR transcriptional regulator [Pseudoruegeria sp. M32A2M]
MDPILNSPEARQGILKTRAASGAPLVLVRLAEEFGVSADTIRRDLLALEAEGAVQRVRGGALPVSRPAPPLRERQQASQEVADRIAAAALDLVQDGMVVMFDGGTTLARLARALPPLPRALAVTPSPVVATELLARGTETILIGGRLSAFGGVAVGHEAVAAVSDIAADLCLLGACGFDPEFGLGADDADEAALSRAMRAASSRAVVLTGAAKLGRRARHRVCRCDALDLLVTDASPELAAPIAETGLEIRHV